MRRINTAKLNKWLGETVNVNPPTLKSGKEVKLKYITQISSRPQNLRFSLIFLILLMKVIKRFLIRELKKTFDFKGVIIKLIFTKIKNPYEK